MTVSFPEQFNMATYFLDDRIKEGLSDRIAIYYKDRTYTYGDVQKMANRLGKALLTLGVEMEDRVLMVLPDSIRSNERLSFGSGIMSQANKMVSLVIND